MVKFVNGIFADVRAAIWVCCMWGHGHMDVTVSSY